MLFARSELLSVTRVWVVDMVLRMVRPTFPMSVCTVELVVMASHFFVYLPSASEPHRYVLYILCLHELSVRVDKARVTSSSPDARTVTLGRLVVDDHGKAGCRRSI
jgi:hypothetical protein